MKNQRDTIGRVFYHIKDYNPKKILHVGGHIGEEGNIYKSIGAEFLFVEPVPEYAEKIRKRGFNVLEVAIGERGEREFNVRGAFSSFLKRKKSELDYQRKWLAKTGEKQYKIKVKVIPLSDIQEGFDTLVVDTEGTVLDVLKSGNLIFKTIIAEIRQKGPAYEGEVDNKEIENYLIEHNYIKDKQYDNNIVFIKRTDTPLFKNKTVETLLGQAVL